eukprot:1155043-Pelagomonas_calceolata.AAC.4
MALLSSSTTKLATSGLSSKLAAPIRSVRALSVTAELLRVPSGPARAVRVPRATQEASSVTGLVFDPANAVSERVLALGFFTNRCLRGVGESSQKAGFPRKSACASAWRMRACACVVCQPVCAAHSHRLNLSVCQGTAALSLMPASGPVACFHPPQCRSTGCEPVRELALAYLWRCMMVMPACMEDWVCPEGCVLEDWMGPGRVLEDWMCEVKLCWRVCSLHCTPAGAVQSSCLMGPAGVERMCCVLGEHVVIRQLHPFHLQNKRGGRVQLKSIVMPEMEFNHPEKGEALFAMELALSLEKESCLDHTSCIAGIAVQVCSHCILSGDGLVMIVCGSPLERGPGAHGNFLEVTWYPCPGAAVQPCRSNTHHFNWLVAFRCV